MFGDDPSAIVRTILAASDFIIANSDATHRLYRKGDRSFRLYNASMSTASICPTSPSPEP